MNFTKNQWKGGTCVTEEAVIYQWKPGTRYVGVGVAMVKVRGLGRAQPTCSHL